MITDEKIVELIITKPKCEPETRSYKVMKINGYAAVVDGLKIDATTLGRIIKKFNESERIQKSTDPRKQSIATN